MNEQQKKAILALNRCYSMNQIDKEEFITLTELVMKPVQLQEVPVIAAPNPVLDKLLEDSELPRWVWIKLNRNGVYTVRDLARLHKTDILRFKWMGRKSLSYLDEFLVESDLHWAMDV